MAAFLRKRGHSVDVIAPTHDNMRALARKRISLLARVSRRLNRRRSLPHLWDLVADAIEPRVRAGGYHVVIGRSPDVATVLTRPLGASTIYDMANVGFLEEYYSGATTIDDVENTYRHERAIFESVDRILTPHPVLTDYFTRYLSASPQICSKTTTIRLGADVTSRRAAYAESPRIVYAGSYHYIQDPLFLCTLTTISPAPIDCYGFRDPNRSFFPAALNYCGFRDSVDFLADYQFGLITVSRDVLRQHSPATKFPYYFSYGLPVLFPEWMKEGHEYPSCAIPYTESTFASQVLKASDRTRWCDMSAAAADLGRQLSWDNVLRPLADIVTSVECARTA